MNHFKSNISPSIQSKILSVIELAKDEFINNRNSDCIGMCEQVDEISGIELSGWLPFQDGGYSVTALYESGIDKATFTEKHSEFVNSQYEECFNSFLSDNNIDTVSVYEDLTQEQQEALSEYECDWFSDGAWLTLNVFAKMRSDHNHSSGVTVELLINYKNAEYGRDKYVDELYKRVYTFSEFATLSNADIIANIKY